MAQTPRSQMRTRPIRVTDLDKTVAKVILCETKAISDSLVLMTGYA